jgi:hypothetical protein
VHHRAEDDRRDQHSDRLDEGIAERLHRGCQIGISHAERDAKPHRDQDLHPQFFPPGLRAPLLDRENSHFRPTP